MKKKNNITLFVAFFLMVSCIGSVIAFRNYCNVSSLILDNVEALSEGEPANGSNFTKQYITGLGLYITEINGNDCSNISNIYIGMRLFGSVVGLPTSVKAEWVDEYTIVCLPEMGCYSSCNNVDWKRGKETDRLDNGCN